MMTTLLLFTVVIAPIGIAETATLVQHALERRKLRLKVTK